MGDPKTVLFHVNLVQEAADAVEILTEHTGLSATDVINKALLNTLVMSVDAGDPKRVYQLALSQPLRLIAVTRQ